MDEQRKLRNLLSYTKMDSVEEIEEVGKLYEELLAYINKQEQFAKDVARYFKLSEMLPFAHKDKYSELFELKQKLSKVGKEEWNQ